MRRIKEHSLQKLKYFQKYINAYLVATQKLSQKYYIDGFAGTGKCILCDNSCKSKGGGKCVSCSNGKKIDGSALITLKATKDFTGYTFVELKKENIVFLKKAIQEEIISERISRTKILKGDCNQILEKEYQHIVDSSKYAGIFIFLDPAGSELRWETVKNLYGPKTDLLILYPYDMSLARLKDYPKKIDKFYGSGGFEKYKSGLGAIDRRKKLLDFYINNLKNLGFTHVVYKQIKEKIREGKPLYHLIFATNNDFAKKIMDDIFNKELDGQKKLKLGYQL